MATTRIAVIVGSLRKESWNRKMAAALARLAPDGVELVQLEIGDLPLFNQDLERDPAEPVKRLKAGVAAAAGVIFVTPEYNRSMPGVLKNAIDHVSRPHGENGWQRKPAGVIGVSPGATGTALAQQHLRNVLAAVDMPVLAGPEAFIQAKDTVFDAAGELTESSAKFVKGWLDAYLAFMKRVAA